jgi:16S rRNA A1518/A1519 N6-dimethyltransferase RsmA/KsgA/DIM1 with predicted DNA glycosylase/AP lyase activity
VPQAKLLEITQILFDNLPMQKIIRAKKSLGQNFLIDNEALFDISDSLIISEKHIIEVGPGYGALTEYIVQQQPKTLDLVELDQDMIQILEERVLTEWKLPRS